MKDKHLEIKGLIEEISDQRKSNDSSFCPSEIARIYFDENWRDGMDMVRIVADELVKENKLITLQKGVLIQDLPSEAKGPIRLKKKD
ncbi:DUF3253 domain-containing protein [Christiangramia marina]|uniref:DUF3253 domain-containing protein n=1 Tax=Christiangramia marina TaxID=409436 RepID=UPI003AA9080B